jgi:hypothetical protein
MGQSPSEANSRLGSQEIPPTLYGTQSFLTVYRKARPRPYVTFHNKLFSYGEKLLAPPPTPKLKDPNLRLKVMLSLCFN